MSASLTKYLVSLFILVSACNNRPANEESLRSLKADSGIKYARRFNIEKKDGYTVLTVINPWQGAVDVNHKYYLVKRGDNIPAGVNKSSIIYVPVRKIICMSTTYLAMISALGEEESVKGISGDNLIYNESIKEKVRKGDVSDVGYEDNLNKELIIQIAPDLIMVYGIGGEAEGYLNKMKESGFTVLFNADYLETDPLGKAEWIKALGALFCKEKLANDLFYSILNEYNEIKSTIREKSVNRPSVLLGLPWKDTWFISPGNSYMSRLISDAGGSYLWHDKISDISMPFGIENVYMKALKADYWLNVSNVNTLGEIAAIDIRLGDLPVFRSGKIFNNNKRVSATGGNDYWESGAFNPQIILKDISAILHPDIFPGYELFYYKKIN